jgi:thymidylate kinase
VRDGFLRAAEREVRASVLDASRPFDAVQDELRRAVRELVS